MPDIDPLRTLADLLAGGRAPAEAFALLSRAGAPPWAAEVRAALAAGGDAAGAFARSGALDPAELAAIGGAAVALDPAALRLVARRRAVRRAARRASLRALALPALGALATAITGLWLPRAITDRVVDLLPLALATAAVLLAARPAVAARLAPLLDRLPGRRDTEPVRALWAAAPLDAAGFARAARFTRGAVARAFERAGRRLGAGESALDALPSAAEVGPDAAGAALAGLADPAGLAAAADAADRAEIARWAFAARLVGWAALFFVSVRLAGALLTADLGDMGGLEQLVPGFDPAALDELMREIEGR